MAQAHNNEGDALSTGHGKKRRARKPLSGDGLSSGVDSGEKWIDFEMVMNKVERRADGKLGIRERNLFVLWRRYSGKTFDELEDLVPMKAVSEGEIYRVLSVIWLVWKKFTAGGESKLDFRFEDMGVLLLMKRVEDALGGSVFTADILQIANLRETGKEGFASKTYLPLTNEWIRRMRSKGLVEQIPGLKVYEGHKVAMYRVSATGRELLRHFVECVTEVHKDIRWYVKDHKDSQYLRRIIARFCLGVDYNTLLAADGTGVTLDEIQELAKKDLYSMGRPKGGIKPSFWKDLPD